jgi:hypothetical protein
MDIPWITDRQVQEVVSLTDAIEAVARSIVREIEGNAGDIAKRQPGVLPAVPTHSVPTTAAQTSWPSRPGSTPRPGQAR